MNHHAMPAHFVSATCGGEVCKCRRPATHKIGEEIAPDDPGPRRHNLTAYVCCRCFAALFGPAAPCRWTLEEP